jgi:uncharacterized protein YukE
VYDSGGGSGIKIPTGHPGQLLAAAGKLSSVADSFGDLHQAHGIASRLSDSTWRGLANVAFHSSCATVSQAGTRSSHAMRDGASVLKRLANQLEDAIDKAKKSAKEYEDAKAAYDDASFKLNALAGDGDDEVKQIQSRLEDRASGATDDMDAALKANQAANHAAEHAAHAAAARFHAIAGQAAPVPLIAQPGAKDVTLSSSGEKDEASLRVLVFKIGGSESALVERRADGTWTVTTADGLEAGIEADLKPGVGAKGSDEAGRLGAGPDMQAALVAQMEKGTTWKFASLPMAMRFLNAKQHGEPPPDDAPLVYVPPGGYATPSELSAATMYRLRWNEDWDWAEKQKPIESYKQGGFEASAGASLDAGGSGGSVEGTAGETLGRKVNYEDNTVTRYSKATVGVNGEVHTVGAEGHAKFQGEAVTSVTRTGDNDDSPLKSFSVSATDTHSAGLKFGGHLPGGASPLTGGDDHAIRYERQVTLDATQPENRAAVENYLKTGGMDPDAVHELNHRLQVDGTVEVREYGTSSSTSGFEADAKVAGVSFEHTESRTKLLHVEQQLPGAGSPTEIKLPR